MKAYRRGESVCSWPPDEITTLWWFGAGNIPSWWYGGLWRQYRYRGEHRGNRFSLRVVDLEWRALLERHVTLRVTEVQPGAPAGAMITAVRPDAFVIDLTIARGLPGH